MCGKFLPSRRAHLPFQFDLVYVSHPFTVDMRDLPVDRGVDIGRTAQLLQFILRFYAADTADLSRNVYQLRHPKGTLEPGDGAIRDTVALHQYPLRQFYPALAKELGELFRFSDIIDPATCNTGGPLYKRSGSPSAGDRYGRSKARQADKNWFTEVEMIQASACRLRMVCCSRESRRPYSLSCIAFMKHLFSDLKYTQFLRDRNPPLGKSLIPAFVSAVF